MIRSRASVVSVTSSPSSSLTDDGTNGQRVTFRKRKRMVSRRFGNLYGVILLSLALGVVCTLCAVLYVTLFSLSPVATPTTVSQNLLRHTISQHRAVSDRKEDDQGKNGNTFHATTNLYNFETHSTQAPVCTKISEDSVISYTLVTQSSTSRLWMMRHHCQLWPQSISIAIAVDVDETGAPKDEKHSLSKLKQELVDYGCSAEKLSVAVVPVRGPYKKKKKKHNPSDDKPHLNTTTSTATAEYPVNFLRNQALSQVQTSHVVYLDIDFWPSPDLYDTLNQESVRQHWIHNNNNNKMAMVVPAFMIPRQCRQYRDCRDKNIKGMPKTKGEMLSKLKEGYAFQFDPTNRGGHGSTLYKEWKTQKPDELLEIPCVLSNRYEPYLVFRYCKDVPPFQAAFTGYGKNKMTWIVHLRRLGWRFWQLPSYCTHFPHLDSPTRRMWNGGKHGELMHRPDDDTKFDFAAYPRGQNDLKFLEFKRWLYRTVPNQEVLPKCPKPQNNVGDDDAKLWVPRKTIRQYHEEYAKYGEEVEKLRPKEKDQEEESASEDEEPPSREEGKGAGDDGQENSNEEKLSVKLQGTSKE